MPATLKIRKSAYRAMLLKKRQELLVGARNTPEALSAIQSADEMEFAVRSVEQDVNVTTASVRSRMLRQIDYALERVAGGTYGECQACGEHISANRLKAILGWKVKCSQPCRKGGVWIMNRVWWSCVPCGRRKGPTPVKLSCAAKAQAVDGTPPPWRHPAQSTPHATECAVWPRPADRRHFVQLPPG